MHLTAEGRGSNLDGILESAGWEVFATPDLSTARVLVAHHPGCVGLVSLEGRLLSAKRSDLEQLFRESNSIEWVGIIEPQRVDEARERRLLPGYLFDYHTCPVDRDRLLHTLGHAAGMAQAKRAANGERQGPISQTMLIGTSARMEEVHRAVQKIAAVDASVMIFGESGTGKELAAQSIHQQSRRAKGPFVAINCGALLPELIRAELFGHEKGAFTGAHRLRIGKIELAHEGTVFLDEIGDLPLDLQVNLLRFLQESEIDRLGGSESIRVDARIITATHIDLKKAVDLGRFREDLFYRLNVLSLNMPPLRERPEDIEPLTQHYFHQFVGERSSNVKGISVDALRAMRAYDWPGNVRELINRVRRATVMCEHRLIASEDLELKATDGPSNITTIAQARERAERSAILASLNRTAYNISETARQLGVARTTLYRLLNKHGLATSEIEVSSST